MIEPDETGDVDVIRFTHHDNHKTSITLGLDELAHLMKSGANGFSVVPSDSSPGGEGDRVCVELVGWGEVVSVVLLSILGLTATTREVNLFRHQERPLGQYILHRVSELWSTHGQSAINYVQSKFSSKREGETKDKDKKTMETKAKEEPITTTTNTSTEVKSEPVGDKDLLINLSTKVKMDTVVKDEDKEIKEEVDSDDDSDDPDAIRPAPLSFSGVGL